MPLFHYQLIDQKGIRSEGTMEASDKFALYNIIKKDGITIIGAEELMHKSTMEVLNNLPIFNSVKLHDKILFARNLSKMLDAGLPMTRALAIMQREAKGELKKVLTKLEDSLSKGVSLSEGMKQHPKVFSTLFISMVKAGEESGNLSISLQNVSLQMEKSYQLNKKIKGALMYPAVIICLMVAIGVLMMIYMVPTLTATFTSLKVELPLATRLIIGTSNFLVNYSLLVLVGVVALGFSVMYSIRTTKGQRFMDWFLLKLPIVGDMVKQINSARTGRTMSSLVSSGVDIVVALGVTKDVLQNSYYKEVLGEVQNTIQKGATISSVLSKHGNLYPVFVSEMAAVGEETGKIGDMLLSVALFYEEEIDQKTKDMSSVIEPFLMVFIGLAVGFFAISIISPIYSIGDSIG
ncbi:MAG: type II secretion system F family protein [Patescibacteria group bacterium]